ncbi:MAG: hypothetical protein AAGC60_23630 [Acidobacteriota bacterium]
MRSIARLALLFSLLLTADLLFDLPCLDATASADTPVFGSDEALVERVEVPIAGDASVGFDDCPEGVIKDDGTVETGYGWVPSVLVGEYLQTYTTTDFSGPIAQSVCVCWLRTNMDDPSIDFEVVFYRDNAGQPEDEPFAAFPGRIDDLGEGVPAAAFTEVETPVTMPNGRVYIGVRWDATIDRFFFVCTDTSSSSPVNEAWFRDDRADDWESVLETGDPIFQNHRALFVRPVAGPQFAIDVPMLPLDGLLVFALALLAAGLVVSRLRA